MHHARTLRKKGNLIDYILSRGSSFAFIGFLSMGLALGSLFCIGSTQSAQLLRSIVIKNIELQAGQSFLELTWGAAMGFAGIFIFVYICLNSRKGGILIYLVPMLFGLSVGSVIGSVVYSYGYSALSYILLCIFLPRSIQSILLLSLCNKASRYCKELNGAIHTRSGHHFPTALYIIVFGVYFVLEAFCVYIFRSLL